jgi:hypothetical protein
LALVLKVCRNRFSCHGQSVAELAPSELSHFGHSVTIHGPPRRGAGLVSLSEESVQRCCYTRASLFCSAQ